MILTNARILTFDGANRVLDSGSVEVLADGAIGFVRGGRALDAHAVDLQGRLLMPALINAHSHLYSTLARGISLGGPAPKNFTEILNKLWWRLDRALNLQDVYYSALIGLIDSAKCGVGTVIDHHCVFIYFVRQANGTACPQKICANLNSRPIEHFMFWIRCIEAADILNIRIVGIDNSSRARFRLGPDKRTRTEEQRRYK